MGLEIANDDVISTAPSVELCPWLPLCPQGEPKLLWQGHFFLSHAGFFKLVIDAGLFEAAALIVLRPHTWVMNVSYGRLNMNWLDESLPKSTEEWKTHAC